MKSRIEIAVENLVRNAGDNFGSGTRIDTENWNSLNIKMEQKIPDWFIHLFSQYPLAHSTLEIKDKDDEEIEYVLEFVSPEWMEDESIEAYPGCAIFEYGYICIAADPTGGGDPYFINTLEGNNPAVYQIYHDVSDVGEEILAQGKHKIVDSFSQLFELGQFME